MNKKVTILVDLPHYFHKWVHFLSYSNKNFLENKGDDQKLINGVLLSLIIDINKYRGFIDQICLVVDVGTSWRKMIPVKEDFYKSNREEKDYEFDYKKFHAIFDEFVGIVKTKDMYIIGCKNMEADDLIWYISDKLYHQGQSSIILSSDSDLRQLIRSDYSKFDHGRFTYVYDADVHKKKHWVDQYITIEDDEDSGIITESTNLDDELSYDVVSTGFTFKSILNNIYDGADIVDPIKVAFIKMLAGDKTDNVPSVYYKPVTNGFHSFTILRAEGVYNKISDRVNYEYFLSLWNNEAERRELASKVLAEVKSTELSKLSDVADNIKRNMRFVWLDRLVFDNNFYDKMVHYVDGEFADIERLRKHKEFIINGLDVSLLKGSKFETSEGGAIYYDTSIKNTY